MNWDTSNREAMLEALKEVLSGIDGVAYVDRQAVQRKMVSDAQLPAIIIDEAKTKYRWLERHGDRTSHVSAGIALDLQVRASRRSDGPGGNVSTVREAFVSRVILELVEKATLNGTALDAGHKFDVDYLPAPAPYGRALVTIAVDTQEVFDERVRTVWQSFVASVGPEDSLQDHEDELDEE